MLSPTSFLAFYRFCHYRGLDGPLACRLVHRASPCPVQTPSTSIMRALSTLVPRSGPAPGDGRPARGWAPLSFAENFGASHPGPDPLDGLGRQARMPAIFLVRLRSTSFCSAIRLAALLDVPPARFLDVRSAVVHSMLTLTSLLANLQVSFYTGVWMAFLRVYSCSAPRLAKCRHLRRFTCGWS